MRAALRGYKILHERRARCYIQSPMIPYEYVVQRARVLTGHFQLFRRLRRYPTTFQFLSITNPKLAFKILRRTCINYKLESLLLIIATLLELQAFFTAIKNIIFNRIDKVRLWPLIHTSKKKFT